MDFLVGYGLPFGYARVLHRYLALSIIEPFYFNSERVESSLEIVLAGGYELAPKSTTIEHAFADSYQGAYFF